MTTLEDAVKAASVEGETADEKLAVLLGPGAPIVDAEMKSLATSLIDLADALGLKPDAIEKLNAKGVTPRAKWQELGLSKEPTKEVAEVSKTIQAAREWWAQVQFEVVPPMLTAGNSIEEIKEAIAKA